MHNSKISLNFRDDTISIFKIEYNFFCDGHLIFRKPFCL